MKGIPGNHDGKRYDRGRLIDAVPSLEGFVRNFCQAEAGIHQREAPRAAMIQPNADFTLNTPFACQSASLLDAD